MCDYTVWTAPWPSAVPIAGNIWAPPPVYLLVRIGDTTLSRFASGDPEAVRELYREFGRAVFSVAFGALRDRGLAEEAVQLTFLQAWRAAERFDAKREPGPWLYAIARRVAVDLYRRERRHESREATDHDIAILPETFERTWEAWQIRQALDRMPENQRVVIEALHFHGLTQEETAQKLGVALGTVKSRSHRAHHRLADMLSHLREATA